MIKKIFMMTVLMAITFCHSKAQTNLTASDLSAKAGETVTMSVMATGAFDAFSFVVKSPEGIKLSKVQRGALIKAQNDDEEYIYSYANATREDGTRYVQCYSASAIATTEPGEVSKLVFEIDPTVTAGKYDIELLETECALEGQMVSTYTTYTATITVDDATGIDNIGTSWTPEGKIAIYNAAGKMVKQVITDGSKTIGDCLTEQQNGVYIIRTSKGAFKIVK